MGEESKDGSLGEERRGGGLGEESKDGGLGKERKEGGLEEERRDGGLGEETKDGSLEEERKDGVLGEESKDGGLGEKETKQALDSGSGKQNKLHVVADPQSSSLTPEQSSSLKEAQEDGLTISLDHHQDSSTSSPSPPKPSHDDYKPSSDPSDREPSLPEREGEKGATDKLSDTEKVAASSEEELFSDRTQPQSGRPDTFDSKQESENWRSRSTSPLGNPFLDVEGTGQNGTHLKHGEGEEVEDNVPKFTLAIVSRRSRYRAGEWG